MVHRPAAAAPKPPHPQFGGRGRDAPLLRMAAGAYLDSCRGASRFGAVGLRVGRPAPAGNRDGPRTVTHRATHRPARCRDCAAEHVPAAVRATAVASSPRRPSWWMPSRRELAALVAAKRRVLARPVRGSRLVAVGFGGLGAERQRAGVASRGSVSWRASAGLRQLSWSMSSRRPFRTAQTTISCFVVTPSLSWMR